MNKDKFSEFLTGVSRRSFLIMDNFGLDIWSFASNMEILWIGTSHKWWLSARLLLGLTESEALMAHDRMVKTGTSHKYNNRAWRMMMKSE